MCFRYTSVLLVLVLVMLDDVFWSRIVDVSLDLSKEDWEARVEERSLNWLQVLDLPLTTGSNKSVSEGYGVVTAPTNFLLDKNGRVLAGNLKNTDLAEILELLFAE